MTKDDTGNVMVVYAREFQEQDESTSASRAHAEGYFAGASIRRRGEPLSGYALVGLDEYCLGLRAGYFVRQQRAECSVDSTAPRAAPAVSANNRTAGNRK